MMCTVEWSKMEVLQNVESDVLKVTDRVHVLPQSSGMGVLQFPW